MKNKAFTLLLFLISIACISQNTDNNKFFKTRVGNITINIPDGFEPIQNQNGFIHKGSASTILITELQQVPFLYAQGHFTKENFEKDNAKIISTENLTTQAGKQAVLYTLQLNIVSKDSEKTIEYERLILVSGNESTTIFIVVNYPLLVKKIIEQPLRTSLLSVTLKTKD